MTSSNALCEVRRCFSRAGEWTTIWVTLALFLYSLWDFLQGRRLLSPDFAALHAIFEQIYISFANGDRLAFGMSWVQGAAGVAGPPVVISPYGLDFLLTYLLTRPFGLDETVGLLRIDAWRLLGLNIIFAFGCRQWARALPLSGPSADFVFAVTLFMGGTALVVSPSLLIGNSLVPWILLCVTRLLLGPQDRGLFYATGLTIGVLASLGHLFTMTLVPVGCALVAFGLGLASSDCRRLLWANLCHLWPASRGRLVTILLTVVLGVSILSLLLGAPMSPRQRGNEGGMSADLSRSVGASITLNPIGVFFGFPNPSDRTLPPGASTIVPLAITLYGSALGGLLMAIGICRGRHQFRVPLLIAAAFSLGVGLVFSGVRAQLLITPFLSLLAGIGLDMILSMKRVQPARETEIGRIMMTLSLALGGLFFFATAMVLSPGFGSRHQGDMLSLIFLMLSWLALSGAVTLPGEGSRPRLFMIIAVLDLVTFHHLAGQASWMGYGQTTAPIHAMAVPSPSNLRVVMQGVLWGLQLSIVVVWLRLRLVSQPPWS